MATTPKFFVFVLMPFTKDFDDTYKLGIKKACENAGAYAERVDEQIFHESILDRIYNQISKADLIVADMTGRNPNVFYEVGYAHALGKKVVLLTRNSDDIPFDLKHYPHIVYGGSISALLLELEKKIKWAASSAISEVAKWSSQLRFYSNGVSLHDEPVLIHKLPRVGGLLAFDLKIDSHNDCSRVMNFEIFQLGIETTKDVSKSKDLDGRSINSVRLPQGDYLHISSHTFNLMPGAWESLTLQLRTDRQHVDSFGENTQLSLKLNVLSEAGALVLPFKVHFKR